MWQRQVTSWKEAIQLLTSAAAQQPRPPVGALISIAEWDRGEARTASGAVRFVSEPAAVRATSEYPALRLTEHYIDNDELIHNVIAFVESRYAGTFRARWSRRFNREGSESPGWELQVDAQGQAGPHNSPAIAFGAPPISDTAAAVADWLGIDRWDGRAWRFLLADERAVVRGACFEGLGELKVSVEARIAPADLQLQVDWGGHTQGDIIAGSEWEQGSDVRLVAPDSTEYATLYLVHRVEGVLDLVRVHRGPHKEPSASAEVGLVEQCKRDLLAGEGEQIEYKPWTRPGDLKQEEVLRTIVAFANTIGGRLYIGVNDWGEPEGRRALHKVFPPASGKGAPEEQAHKWLRKLVQDKLQPRPAIDVQQVMEVEGEPVLVVAIARGPKPPYAIGGTQILVRRGATSRPPDVSELRRLACQHEPELLSPIDWGG